MNLQALLTEAARLHQQGKLAEAEQLYLRLLQADSRNVPGRSLLGVLRAQQGRNEEAIALLGGAIEATSRDFGALLSYGLLLQRAGRLDEALTAYDRALAVKPDFVEAHFNRAVLLSGQGRPGEALASYDKALALQPNYADAHYNRGTLLSKQMRFEDALASYDRALALNPRLPSALDNRGNALRELGRLDEALASYDRALALDPGYGGAHHNRGIALSEMKRFEEALASFDAALAIRPDFAPAHSSRGAVLWSLKRSDEALASYDRALAANPDLTEAWNNRGYLHHTQQRYADALESYDRALALEPGHVQAWSGRGNALQALNRPNDALASFDKALAIDPAYVEAYANRAIVLWEHLRRLGAAVADLERVLELDPDWPDARGQLLHLKMQGCDWRDFEAQRGRIDAGVRAGKRVVRPFAYQAVSRSPADLMACSKILAAELFPPATPLAGRPGPRGKLRIGYVSGEFRDQATAQLMAGVYEQHDRGGFEILAFDTGWPNDSPMRKRLEEAFDKFVDIAPLSDDAAARAVQAEGIDILVNLNGYFGNQRTGVFARRPAPVQVNYLGFPATLGADYIDYILADATVIPESEKLFYSEKVVWLPDSYQANDSKRAIASQAPTRAEAGLPDGAFVFCNFNQSYKLTPEAFGAWMRILKQVPGSVLWLWHNIDEVADNLRREAAEAGVAPERLIFARALPAPSHLARLTLADLFLDTLPYNAHTTASDALWAGLPLLTCRGTTFPGRVGASLLRAAGLPELIAESMDDYERRAVELARDAKVLKALRDRLAANRPTCALFDTARFTRNLEAAYATMWDIACSGEAPRGFSVQKPPR